MSSILDTYSNRSEANTDKLRLGTLLKALDGVSNSIKLDECGAYHITGSRGSIYTWGSDTPAWVVYIACDSPRHWSSTKAKLSFLAVTQDCSDEGCFKLEALPDTGQAAIIREALGLKKRRQISQETRDLLSAHRRPFLPRQDAYLSA